MVVEKINFATWTSKEADVEDVREPWDDKTTGKSYCSFMKDDQEVFQHVQIQIVFVIHSAASSLILIHLPVHLLSNFDYNPV